MKYFTFAYTKPKTIRQVDSMTQIYNLLVIQVVSMSVESLSLIELNVFSKEFIDV